MPAVARANGTEAVLSPDGTGKKCAFPLTVSTGSATHNKVFVEGIPVAKTGDLVAPHPKRGCEPDVSKLTGSGKVFAAGSGIGRIGDQYGDNIITAGSSKVFAA